MHLQADYGLSGLQLVYGNKSNYLPTTKYIIGAVVPVADALCNCNLQPVFVTLYIVSPNTSAQEEFGIPMTIGVELYVFANDISLFEVVFPDTAIIEVPISNFKLLNSSLICDLV